ncbi:DUF4214 domain-containing protein [Mesobacterium sp. TK19101]|uniref:DUF4214 domain-containing protein n=1 Tax=Mesobacterium hydrothermale TaxID=3111907 RepID=A0ABU6HGT3_9RHOB|nr:DUF4214 domain-containing protein [Mesobacterium sp. TK19101]MEC3861571.1 DUF4214 domain-containing protein [Mesobacterium sp. TK19101]
MAHLASSYTSYENFLSRADAFWTVDFKALNSSGVNATAIVAMETEEDGSSYLNVAIAGTGLTPSQTHAQHVHGLFDTDGAPIDSMSPTLADDADRDGMVEVLEGLGRYGDVLLPLVSPAGGAMPVADENGMLSFVQSYDLNDETSFFSPVSKTDYTADDLMPLTLREIVLHGVDVPDGIGSGTSGEVDGGENGFIGILPAAAGEIEAATYADALNLLTSQRTLASTSKMLGDGNDMYDAGLGDDVIYGQAGNDSINGGADNDTLTGDAGRDVLYGADGDDAIMAGTTDQNQTDAADAGASGALQLGDYDNGYAGGAGDDMIHGGDGDDIITGDDDSRVSDAIGTMFDVNADGSDTIYGGAGNDEIHTGTWADGDQGLNNASTGMMNDRASGGMGNDILRGAGGDDTLFGDRGADNIGGAGGNDMIYGDFQNDSSLELDTGKIFRLYQTAFDRDPDAGGLSLWVENFATGALSQIGVAGGFVGSAEFYATYGGTTNTEYVTALYQNALDRDPDAPGLADWTARLDAGATRAEVLIGFAQSTEFSAKSDSDLNAWVMAQGTHDVLMGNDGDNTLSGGVFSDRFVFSTDAGSSNTVTDLESWDVLDFTAFGYDSASDVLGNMTEQNGAVVFMDMDVTVTLNQTGLADLDGGMFMV